MSENACILDEEQRRLVEKTVADHCRIRGWELFAVNCRSNHLHVVVAADLHPKKVRAQLKAWCSRKLKELEKTRHAAMGDGAKKDVREEWWAERGSDQYLNDRESLEAAVQYVVDGQDQPRDSASGPRIGPY
jgi:REP element-mobilizing transposase RayT